MFIIDDQIIYIYILSNGKYECSDIICFNGYCLILKYRKKHRHKSCENYLNSLVVKMNVFF